MMLPVNFQIQRRHVGAVLLSSVLLCSQQAGAVEAGAVEADAQSFPIKGFKIVGNSLLSDLEINALVGGFTGATRNFGDIQMALEALEAAYRNRGYSAVSVNLPEQEITGGEVTLEVIESRLGHIEVKGNRFFSKDTILASLPGVVSGEIPIAREISQAVGLANENPARKLEVVLKLAEQEGLVDAMVNVADRDPSQFIITLDNTGAGSQTGDHRIGLAWQHANLFDLDHVLTLQYTTAPGFVDQVTQAFAGYHLPLYGFGGSVDAFLGYSNVDNGAMAGGGITAFTGKGNIVGVRLNQNLTRYGEYDHKVIWGQDWKANQSMCEGSVCTYLGRDATSSPFSLSYQGTRNSPRYQGTVQLSYLHNLPFGMNSSEANFAGASHQSATVGTERMFDALRFNTSYTRTLPANWQARVAFSGQYTDDALIQAEQFGLAGSNQVRGFTERAVARDRGVVLNVEAYTPDFGNGLFKGLGLRGVAFYDYGWGDYVVANPGETALAEAIASAGLGLRLSYAQNVSLKLDVAKVQNGISGGDHPDWKTHLQMLVLF